MGDYHEGIQFDYQLDRHCSKTVAKRYEDGASLITS